MKLNKSKELFLEARKHIPGGVNSPVRAFKNIDGNPIFFQSAKGPYLIDADGNQFIDYIGSWGPMILGHSNPIIINAIKAQLELGTSYGAPTAIETSLATLIKSQYDIDKLRMVNSGTEATMSCIRLARGASRRDKIVKFTGCYHGHVDSLLVKAGSGVSTFGLPDSPGIPKSLAEHTASLQYNNVSEIENFMHSFGESVAAIIVEPIAGNMGYIPGHTDFLLSLRKLCDKYGSILIFDEVMSGFRVALGGAQELYRIIPDLTAFGKVIGGGLPVGAFGGKAELMDMLAPEGPIYQAGTLSGNPLAMAAGTALLQELIATNPYEILQARANQLLAGMAEIFHSRNIPFVYGAMGGMFGFFVSETLPNNFEDVLQTDSELFKRIYLACLEEGIYFAPSKFEAGFISTMHLNNVIEKTLEKISKGLKKI
ncbi:MAG: glutamate-1-semialdehyde 2,1-aminomutase [Gammaproteobacteria bacterium]